MRTKQSLSWDDVIAQSFFVDASWNSFDDLWSKTKFEGSHLYVGSNDVQSYAKAKSCAVRWYTRMNAPSVPYMCSRRMLLHAFDQCTTFERAASWGGSRGYRQASIVDLLALLTVGELRTCIYSNLDSQRTSVVVTHPHGEDALVPVLLVGHHTLMFEDGCRGGKGFKPGTPFLFLS